MAYGGGLSTLIANLLKTNSVSPTFGTDGMTTHCDHSPTQQQSIPRTPSRRAADWSTVSQSPSPSIPRVGTWRPCLPLLLLDEWSPPTKK